MARSIVHRLQAQADVDSALEHDLNEGSPDAAERFIADLERAYRHIGRNPASGTPRYSRELGIPALRAWRLTRYPYWIFYVEQASHVYIWRVLHERRNIAAWLTDSMD